MSIEDVTHGESLTERIQYGAVPPSYTTKSKEPSIESLEKDQQMLLQEQKYKTIEYLLSTNANRLVNVPQVVINNCGLYRDSFLQRQLQPILKNSESLTIESFLKGIDSVSENFINCTNTEDIMVNIQPSSYFTNNDKAIPIIPIFHLNPVKRFFVRTGTSVGNGEGNGYITMKLMNFLKGGENLTFDATLGTRTKTSYLLNLNFPINNDPKTRLENLIFMNSRKADWSSHNETLKGFSNKIVKNSNLSIRHELSFENVWRSIAVTDQAASDEILLNCGDDFKSSLIYNWLYDTRSSSFLPKFGKMFKFQFEYAPYELFNQKSNFFKTTFNSVLAIPILDKRIFSNISFNCGYLTNFSKNDYLNIIDKFYIGGPTDVRGFNYFGLGPRSLVGSNHKNHLTSSFAMGDRLGGNLYYTTGFSLFTIIPKIAPGEDYNLKLHGFINAGKLIDIDKNYNDDISKIFTKPTVSTGIGLLYNHPGARFELNFCLPLTHNISDSPRKGFQWGIGLSFL